MNNANLDIACAINHELKKEIVGICTDYEAILATIKNKLAMFEATIVLSAYLIENDDEDVKDLNLTIFFENKGAIFMTDIFLPEDRNATVVTVPLTDEVYKNNTDVLDEHATKISL